MARLYGFLIFVATTLSAGIASATPTRRQLQPPPVFDWGSLEPSTDLNWKPCYNNLSCTQFEVPLDYEDKSAGTTNVAFIKWTSPNKTAEDIVFNPGGPATSGVNHWIYVLPLYKKWLGTSHNLVSFDPRGVNNSGISLSCFPNQKANEGLYDNAISRLPEITTQRGQANRIARDKAYGEWCTAALKNGPAKYANTVAVANDIRNYFETAKKQAGGDPQTAKINYFGISYGTLLGQTIASLFPDRIERMILDGVGDLEQYYDGTWYNSVADTDAAVRYFFQSCYDAGPKLCAFYANSSQAIELRFNKLLTDLDQNPLPVTDKSLKIPMVLTSLDLRGTVSVNLKAPQHDFPTIAAVLVELEKRNGTALAALNGLGAINANYTKNAYFDYSATEPTNQIRCLDANHRFSMKTVDDFAQFVQYQTGLSSYFGPMGNTAAIKCTYMDLAPPKSQQFTYPQNTVKTAFPILFTTTKADPVAPYRSAVKMHQHFENSALLVQDSVGHGANSWFSNCTSNAVQAYLKDGIVPAANTTCGVVGTPFTGVTS